MTCDSHVLSFFFIFMESAVGNAGFLAAVPGPASPRQTYNTFYFAPSGLMFVEYNKVLHKCLEKADRAGQSRPSNVQNNKK